MKTVGILGGLGPLAGAHFYRRLIEMTPARGDEEHIPAVLISDPNVPSRMAHLRGKGPSPVPRLMEVCHQLIIAGAELIALPSSTTSIYYAHLSKSVGIPILNLIDVVADAVYRDRSCKRIGILATTPTCELRVYDQALTNCDIETVYPDGRSQQELMEVISAVKASADQPSFDGNHLRSRVSAIASRDWADAVDALILGCTELPVLFSTAQIAASLSSTVRVFNSTDILAGEVVRLVCG